MEFSKKKVFNGALLVGGTAIGAGMLALPIATAQAGFLPAVCIYVLCWLFSLITGLLLLEVALTMPKDTNILSLSRHYLGPVGKVIALLLYLFLFYSLTIAYVTGGGGVLNTFFFSSSHAFLGILCFTLLFGGFVLAGHNAIHKINLVLMIALAVTYCAFITLGIDKIKLTNLKVIDFKYAAPALPILFTTFSYQGVVPSLLSYCGKNREMARKSIIIGSTIPFVIYVIWDLVFKGIIPLEGEHGLLHAKQVGAIAIEPLQYFLPHAPLIFIGGAFAFFAMTTSFLGVTMGLVDFFLDGFKAKSTLSSRALMALLVFVPPVIISTTNPTIFFAALNYAGGIGCVLLLGMLPTLMVWIKRYSKRHRQEVHGEVPGGRLLFALLIIFMIFEVGLTLA
ncbi:MAG: tyrosine transporter [Simkaniaceae bacterium]|nr:tyrosine transporter [Simkaniaceae bacterium]